MEPTLVLLSETKLIGQKKSMTFSNDQTPALWKGFMPLRKNITNSDGSDLYAVEIYDDPSFFNHPDPDKEFVKWAAVKVKDHNFIPEGMDALVVPEGLYAVFMYKGRAGDAEPTYRYIFGEWLPASAYALDNRPHFALMGDKYENNNPESEEELWIPVRKK